MKAEIVIKTEESKLEILRKLVEKKSRELNIEKEIKNKKNEETNNRGN